MAETHRALQRMRRRPTLVCAFWEQAELFPFLLFYARLNKFISTTPAIGSMNDCR